MQCEREVREQQAACGRGKPRARLVVGERSRRTRQRGSCEAILREPLGIDRITGCGGWAKREDKVGARLVRYLMSEQKRERCRDTATRAKTKFYSYSRTRTTRIHIYIIIRVCNQLIIFTEIERKGL